MEAGYPRRPAARLGVALDSLRSRGYVVEVGECAGRRRTNVGTDSSTGRPAHVDPARPARLATSPGGNLVDTPVRPAGVTGPGASTRTLETVGGPCSTVGRSTCRVPTVAIPARDWSSASRRPSRTRSPSVGPCTRLGCRRPARVVVAGDRLEITQSFG